MHADLPEVHFLLCGDDVTSENIELAEWLKATGIRDRCHLLVRREDIPRLTAALDIATTSSDYGEGFPNVIGEAMAAGLPCVATDVGDSALIVDKAGRIVPPRDTRALVKHGARSSCSVPTAEPA